MPATCKAVLHPAVVVALAFAASSAYAGLGTAIEFYNAKNNHYFLTANPAEAAALDAGTTVKGWTRTGGQFTVFTEPADGLAAVCRFFGTPGKGPDSHFYTADAAECAKVRTLPAWTFEEIAFYIPLPGGDGQCGGNWPVYRSYYTDQIADANHRFTVDLTAHVRMPKRRGDVLEGIVMCAPVTDEEREADVVRFLEQATLGPTEALIAEVRAKGIEKYIDEQLALNVTRYTQKPHSERLLVCIDDKTPPVTPEKFCATNKQYSSPVGWEFFRQARDAPDQLRLRMAHNWHELFLAENFWTYAHADFQQRIRDAVFGSFENFLLRYTLSPQLGKYQNWVNNVYEINGVKPNENYARELLQLFSIGVSELNEDGTLRLSATGSLIPTYQQADVEVLARILTGYAFPPLPPGITDRFNEYYVGDMVPYERNHDTGAKSALGGRVQFPAGGTAANEVAGLVRALAGHPNTPPFIVKQMIQKTVTSAPTPGYVSRVVARFKNNGMGARGDLAAVTKAILLDPEARGARKIDPEYGRLREPALFWTGLIRWLDVTTDGVIPYDMGWPSQQLFVPPTVFGYYPMDYTLAGGTIPAPEFAIFGAAEYISRVNQVNDLLYHDAMPWTLAPPLAGWGPRDYVPNPLGTSTPTLAGYVAVASDTNALVDRANRFLLHGAMKPTTRRTIVNAVERIDPADGVRRAKLAVNLVLISMDYLVQK